MNILIHATLYPEHERDKRPNTSMFLHYYVKEWCKAGHSVLVLHHQTRFPGALVRAYTLLARLPGLGLARDFLSGYKPCAEGEGTLSGALIVRRSMTKRIPRTLPGRAAIQKQACWARGVLSEKAFKPDLVLCDFLSPGLLVALKLRDQIDAPIHLIVHDTDMGYFARALTRGRALDAARRASMLIFRSQSARRAFETMVGSPASSYILASGLPADFQANAAPRTRVRRLLFAGQLVSRKRVQDLIEAFGRLTQPDMTLDIVGDGPERGALSALAARQPNARRIAFHGKLPREDVLRLMRDCDGFVMLSDMETFGIVYIEAMACGMITIASRSGSMEGVITEGENGFLIAPGDVDALAARLNALMRADSKEIERVSKAAMLSTARCRDDLLARDALRAFVSGEAREGT